MTLRDITNKFFARLPEAQHQALLLNLDPILALLRTKEAGMRKLFTDCLQNIIQQTNTRVVVISGRSAVALKEQLGLDPAPEVWGNYSLERVLPSGDYHVATLDQRQLAALKAAEHAVGSANLGTLLEPNLGALTLTWRALSTPAAKHARNLAFRAWNPIAQSNRLLLQECEGGMQLRLPDYDTARMVETLISELGEQSIIAYIGTDRVDGNAFRTLREQDLAVAIGDEGGDTSASLWIESIESLMHFFAMWANACGPQVEKIQ